jgi:hypothetical protein
MEEERWKNNKEGEEERRKSRGKETKTMKKRIKG